jgi:hypothetical protein
MHTRIKQSKGMRTVGHRKNFTFVLFIIFSLSLRLSSYRTSVAGGTTEGFIGSSAAADSAISTSPAFSADPASATAAGAATSVGTGGTGLPVSTM